MKKTNKFSGKKLRRPLTPSPFTQISTRLITSVALNDAQFRLVCLLFSYSNGTTISVKNLAEKLNKNERTILDLYNQLKRLGILNFTDTYIELFLFGDEKNCEILQCGNPHPEIHDCDLPQDDTNNSAPATAENRSFECENPQSDTLKDADIEVDTDTYNIINNKMILDKNINNNNSVSTSEDFLISKIEDDVSEIKSELSVSEEIHTPIIGKDFNPKEELILDNSKVNGKSCWKLKNDVTSNFIEKNYTYKLVDVYNQWINLDITNNSQVPFRIFEIVIIDMILSTRLGKRIDNNHQLNLHLRIYPIDDTVKDITEWMIGMVDDLDTVVTKIKPYRLNINANTPKQD